MTTGNDRAEGQAYLKVADVACQKKLPWNSKSYSNTCSRMAKVAEVEERMINGEQTTVVNYYCTQHTNASYVYSLNHTPRRYMDS